MQTLELHVTEQTVQLLTPVPKVTTGQYKAVKIEVTYSPEWDGLMKRIFINGIEADKDGDCLYVPLLFTTGPVDVCVYGYEATEDNELKLVYSPTPSSLNIKRGSWIADPQNPVIPSLPSESVGGADEESIKSSYWNGFKSYIEDNVFEGDENKIITNTLEDDAEEVIIRLTTADYNRVQALMNLVELDYPDMTYSDVVSAVQYILLYISSKVFASDTESSSSIDDESIKSALGEAFFNWFNTTEKAENTEIVKNSDEPYDIKYNLEQSIYDWIDSLKNNDSSDEQTLSEAIEGVFTLQNIIFANFFYNHQKSISTLESDTQTNFNNINTILQSVIGEVAE